MTRHTRNLAPLLLLAPAALTALAAAWFTTTGVIAAAIQWPGLFLILGGFAALAHRTTTPAREKAH
jgi:hypothetical protein